MQIKIKTKMERRIIIKMNKIVWLNLKKKLKNSITNKINLFSRKTSTTINMIINKLQIRVKKLINSIFRIYETNKINKIIQILKWEIYYKLKKKLTQKKLINNLNNNYYYNKNKNTNKTFINYKKILNLKIWIWTLAVMLIWKAWLKRQIFLKKKPA